MLKRLAIKASHLQIKLHSHSHPPQMPICHTQGQLYPHITSDYCVKPGLICLLCGAGRFYKIWYAFGQHITQYTERRLCMYTYNYNILCVILCNYYVRHAPGYIPIIIRKIYKKYNLQRRLGCCYLIHIFQN